MGSASHPLRVSSLPQEWWEHLVWHIEPASLSCSPKKLGLP